jgi:hypothetical protein
MLVTISLNDDAGVEDVHSLLDWLKRERVLRGSRVTVENIPPRPERMGSAVETIGLTVSSGAATLALRAVCRVITTWIETRRSNVTATIRANGTVEIKADHLKSDDLDKVIDVAVKRLENGDRQREL